MTSPPNPTANPSNAPESFELTLPDDPASGKDWYLWAGVLALLVMVVFYPAITGQLVWDDDHHVGLIATLPGLDGLAKIWTSGATPQYYPLSYTTWWLERMIWNDSTLGYHLGNMLLHAGSAVLVWRLLRRLKLPGAWLAAAIWAVHPIQAESVCWMSERKNVLSGLLLFASIWYYLDFSDPPARAGAAGDTTFRLKHKGLAYALSLLLLILGLLSKTVVCAMPAVLLIIFWWQGRKILSRKTLIPLIPFFAAGLAMSVVTVYLETAAGGNVEARGPDWAITPMQRVLIASRGVWFYPCKLIWPAKLTFSYPRILPDPRTMGSGLYAVQWVYFAAAVAAIAGLWLGRNRLGRGPLAAILFYGVTLFPSLGFINIYPMRYSFVADHFQYLAGLGLIVLAVAAAGQAAKRLAPGAALSLAALVLIGCCILAWRQSQIYASPTTLWTDTLAKNPDSWMASNNLASEYVGLAQQKARDALVARHDGLSDEVAADTQDSQNYYDQAEKLFRHALELHPANYISHTGLGEIYELTGRSAQALMEMRIAAEADDRDDPLHQSVTPYVEYAKILRAMNPEVDVLPWLKKAGAVALRPRSKPREVAELHLTLGDYWWTHAAAARAHTGTVDEETALLNRAIDELKAGLKGLPSNIPGQYELGLVYQRLGELDRRRADGAKAQGRLQEAAEFAERGRSVDDPNALLAYQTALANSPNGQHAGAMVGVGELYYERTTFDLDNQYPLISDLLNSMKYIKDGLSVNPRFPDAADYLAKISQRLYQEGLLDDQHEATWSVLKQKLDALTLAEPSKETIAAADKAAAAALWPTPRTDPLRPPLAQFHSAAQIEASIGGSPESLKDLHDAAANVLTGLNRRDPRRSVILDAMSAALCYEGAVSAGDHNGAAWLKLQAVADTLAKAAAASGDPDLRRASVQAQFVLDHNRAATQPAANDAPIPPASPRALPR